MTLFAPNPFYVIPATGTAFLLHSAGEALRIDIQQGDTQVTTFYEHNGHRLRVERRFDSDGNEISVTRRLDCSNTKSGF